MTPLPRPYSHKSQLTSVCCKSFIALSVCCKIALTHAARVLQGTLHATSPPRGQYLSEYRQEMSNRPEFLKCFGGSPGNRFFSNKKRTFSLGFRPTLVVKIKKTQESTPSVLKRITLLPVDWGLSNRPVRIGGSGGQGPAEMPGAG